MSQNNANQVMSNLVNAAGLRQKVINNKTYSIKLLPASRGMKLASRMFKTLAPALGVLLDSGEADKEALALYGEDESLFTNLAVALVRQIDELSIDETVKELFGGLSCDGVAIDFDTHFAGNYGDLLILATYCLKENYGDDFFTVFLKESGLKIPTLRSMVGTIPKTQSSED